MQNKTIWILWLQGWENAPWLQQRVAESWIKNNPDWSIKLINEEVIKVWSKILLLVPNSVLFLKHFQMNNPIYKKKNQRRIYKK